MLSCDLRKTAKHTLHCLTAARAARAWHPACREHAANELLSSGAVHTPLGTHHEVSPPQPPNRTYLRLLLQHSTLLS